MNSRPNILFILSDQHNPHFLGFEGNETVHTPNLDRLAAEGAAFTSAYCQNPLCAPSRSSLITGKYCRHTGIYDNKHILEANSATFPRVLTAAGYRSCLIGKAHFNGEQFHGYQMRPYGDLYGQAHQPDPARDESKGESGLGDVLGNSGPSGIPLPLTQTEICVAEAAKWLQGHAAMFGEKPFLLSVHFDKPHFPINPPAVYYEKYAGKVSLPEPPPDVLDNAVPFVRKAFTGNGVGHHYGKRDEEQLRALAAYYGCVEWIDDAVGRLLQTLQYLGFADNTMVVYASDHGEMAGEKGAWQKSVFFDASARIPLIVRWPRQIAPGTRIAEPVGLIDLFPTFSEAAASPVPDECDGLSLLPLLTGVSESLERDGIFCESTILGEPEAAGCMIRERSWKYCCYLDGSEELYHVADDPGEWNNVVRNSEYAEIAAALRAKVLEFWKPDDQMKRFSTTPRMAREKHFYPYSNQFVLGDGTVIDARP